MATSRLAECIAYPQIVEASQIETLQELFLSALTDQNDDVRSNAAFGLGMLVANTGVDWSP